MYQIADRALGIYEKAMPASADLSEKLSIAKQAGFEFLEISIDESDDRLARLDWKDDKRRMLRESIFESGIRIPSMCLSGHRRFPLGSTDNKTRERGKDIMKKAIEFAVDIGIRTIQLAGYDVYYEASTTETRNLFIDGLHEAVNIAANAEVMLGMEIMDYWRMSSITAFMEYSNEINSPWFAVYPDVGNLSAWGHDVEKELEIGKEKIVGIHLKETIAVRGDFPGQFRDVPFGAGCVDFVKVFRKLKDLNYAGPFLIEMWTEKSEDPIKEITEARRWIIDKMNKAGY